MASLMTEEYKRISKLIISGIVPEFDITKRPNKVKETPNKTYISVSQQKAIKR